MSQSSQDSSKGEEESIAYLLGEGELLKHKKYNESNTAIVINFFLTSPK